MNRHFALIVIVIMTISLFAVPAYSDSAAVTLSVQKAGSDTIDVVVTLSNNPGIAAFVFDLNFDNKMLTPESIARGSVTAAGTFANNLQPADKTTLTCITAIWVNSTNVTADGVLYTVRFKINQNAYGNTQFWLSYEQGNICNQQSEDVPITVQNAVYALSTADDIKLVIAYRDIYHVEDIVGGSVWTEIQNNTAADIDAIVVLALYEADTHKMAGVLVNRHEILKGATVESNFNNIEFPAERESRYYCKLMLWDLTYEMNPLTNGAEFDVAQKI